MANMLSSMTRSNEILAIDLRRALSRLERKILSSPPDSRLMYSSYERAKTSVNLEYARTLLLRLEQEASSIKVQSRKQAAQDDLIRQRLLIKRLNDTLHDLDNQDPSPDDASSTEEQEGEEDLLAEINIPSSLPPSTSSGPELLQPSPPASQQQPITSPTPNSILRNRHDHHHNHHPSATPNPSSSPSSNPPSSTIPILESDTSTQVHLTSSLLSLATALKTSSLAMSESIALDAETLARATDGLDRNTTGMHATGQRMGLLRRMTEGRGWWGRMMLYAWIGGLWVLALVIVFVLPRLRF